jgi:putative peptide zinc metalloprotease protein
LADTLLPLREDIELSSTGERQWTLFDKGSTKYYRLHELPFLILSYYGQSTNTEELLQNVLKYHPCTMEDIEDVIKFCKDKFLFQSTSSDIQRLVAANNTMKSVPWYSKLVHGYLFFKIHFINPDEWLSKTQRYVRFFYTKPFLTAAILFFLVNLVFIADRFSEFMSTLTNFETMGGILYLAASIAFVKFFHELGHAYTAKRYGCTVSSIGVAFMVFYPMPYTDTSDSWRFDKAKRMQIALAGIKTELLIASLAMSAWLVLPEGALKSMAFFIVGVSFISTLLVNLTPFMRFDGYYALSDYLGIENLHARAFAQAKGYVKRSLWGIEIPVEPFDKKTKSFLILFAFMTWIYRFILFAGIAYLVYSHTFKVLGIILFWIEVWYFILRPVVHEMKEWYKMRSAMKIRPTTLITWCILFIIGGALFIPYSTSLHLPAVIESNTTKLLYAEYDSQVIYVHSPGWVKKGELILSAQTISNDHERKSALRKLQLFRTQASNAFLLDNTLQDTDKYRQSAAAEIVKIRAAESMRTNMNILAPIDGYLLYEQPITEGQFVGIAQLIGRVLESNSVSITAYVEDIDLSLVQKGNKGEVFDALTLERFPAHVVGIEMAPETAFNELLLSSKYQGSITVGENNVPQRPHYKIRLSSMNLPKYPVEYKRFGEVKLNIKQESFFERFANASMSIFITESQF